MKGESNCYSRVQEGKKHRPSHTDRRTVQVGGDWWEAGDEGERRKCVVACTDGCGATTGNETKGGKEVMSEPGVRR